MKSVIRVVKREEKEARNNLLVTDDATMVQRSTPEGIVKSWIAESRERRRTQAANCLREIRRRDENRIVAFGQTAATFVLGFLILISFARGSVAAKALTKDTGNHSAVHGPLVENHFVTVENLRVHYIDSGVGPTVVMIHGNVGHSWGASLALAYALKYPGEVSTMVLLTPAAYPDDGGSGLLRTTTPLIGRKLPHEHTVSTPTVQSKRFEWHLG